jgi:CRISPR-associated protein Cmr5
MTEINTISLDQRRAAYAWQCVRGQNKDYENLAKAAPAMLMNNGLMQTLAFYQNKSKDKGKEHHKALLKHILGWLTQQQIVPSDDYEQAMQALHSMNAADYRHASAEALEIVKWLRQLAPTVN